MESYHHLGLYFLLAVEIMLLLPTAYLINLWSEYKVDKEKPSDTMVISNIINDGFVALLVAICLANLFYSKGGATFIYFQF